MTVYRQTDPPLTASKDDRWVDTGNENAIWVAMEDYEEATVEAALTHLMMARATVVYAAALPEISSLSDTVHPSIPMDLAVRIAEQVAANLASSDEGANDKKVTTWRTLFASAMRQASQNKNALTNSMDVRPG